MEMVQNLQKTAVNIGDCCTNPILAKTQNIINNNLFRSDFKEVFCFFVKPKYINLFIKNIRFNSSTIILIDSIFDCSF